MKYTIETKIGLDQNKLFDLLLDRNSLLLWPSGYSHVELVSGNPGKSGVKYKLITSSQYKQQTIIETIVEVYRPDNYVTEYTDGKFFFRTNSRLSKIDENLTKIHVELEGTSPSKRTSFFLWLLSIPSKKYSKKMMQRFKEFAEGLANTNASNFNPG